MLEGVFISKVEALTRNSFKVYIYFLGHVIIIAFINRDYKCLVILINTKDKGKE